MEQRKVAVLTTALAAFALLSSASLLYHNFRAPMAIVLETSRYPSFGNPSAKVHVVIIEDFNCKGCRKFMQEVYPKIQANYVSQGQVRYTVVPVAFLSGSKPIANAALEVYRRSPDRFMPFVEGIFVDAEHLEMNERALIRIARRVGGIDLERLHRCMETRCHYAELDQNLAWAQGVMGRQFTTPAVYVNGVSTSPSSYSAIKEQIEEILKERS